jgi:putative transcriptional regulator
MNCTNKFLVSLPLISDYSFKNSIIYVSQHNADGAVGFIFNKPLDGRLSANLRKSMGINMNIPIYYGGPVDLSSAVVIHKKDAATANSIKISKELYLTRDKKIIDSINSGLPVDFFKLIIGYSGWGPSQLESEILGSRSNGLSSWTVVDFDKNLFWEDEHNTTWNTGMQMAAEKLTNNILKEH